MVLLNAQCARLTVSKHLTLSIAQTSLALLSFNRCFIFAGYRWRVLYYAHSQQIRHCEEARRSNLPTESGGLVCRFNEANASMVLLNAQCARLLRRLAMTVWAGAYPYFHRHCLIVRLENFLTLPMTCFRIVYTLSRFVIARRHDEAISPPSPEDSSVALTRLTPRW